MPVVICPPKSRLGIAAGLAFALATLRARAEEPSPTSPTSTPEVLPPLPAATPEAPAGRTGEVRGDEPQSPVAAPIAEDARLERFLEVEASTGRRGRIHNVVVDTLVIALTVPPGVILITKQDPALELAGLALLIQGGWAVIALPFTLQRTTLETLHDHYGERKARGQPEAERIAETEREWQKDIAEARSAATTNAVLDLTLGGLEFAGGLTLLVVNGSVLGDDRRTRGGRRVGARLLRNLKRAAREGARSATGRCRGAPLGRGESDASQPMTRAREPVRRRERAEL
jgi:hypothetical protein